MFVAINLLTVPPGAGATLEQRFTGRAALVQSAPGFLSFELLRPVEGTDDYLVMTHWRGQEDFQAWLASPNFAAGHGGSGGDGGEGSQRPARAASGSQIWTFEVVQDSRA